MLRAKIGQRLVVTALLTAVAAGSLAGQRPPTVGEEPVVTVDSVIAMTIRLDVRLPGAPEAIYDAITGDVSPWWNHRFSKEPHTFRLEARPGGRFIEIFDESGDGVVHADVIYAHRGRQIRFDGPLGFSGQPVKIVTTYEFEALDADSTLLSVRVEATGPLDEAERESLRRVWRHFIVARFKPYWEERHARVP